MISPKYSSMSNLIRPGNYEANDKNNYAASDETFEVRLENTEMSAQLDGKVVQKLLCGKDHADHLL